MRADQLLKQLVQPEEKMKEEVDSFFYFTFLFVQQLAVITECSMMVLIVAKRAKETTSEDFSPGKVKRSKYSRASLPLET